MFESVVVRGCGGERTPDTSVAVGVELPEDEGGLNHLGLGDGAVVHLVVEDHAARVVRHREDEKVNKRKAASALNKMDRNKDALRIARRV